MDISIAQLDKIQIHFISAQPRTGSTLLSNMLNNHPEIICISEIPFANFLYPKYHAIQSWNSKNIEAYCADFFLFSNKPRMLIQFSSEEDLKNILEQHKEMLNYERVVKLSYLCFFPNKDKSKVKVVMNKELLLNNYLEKSIQHFPNSRYVFLCRNPLDVLPRYKRLKKINQESNGQLLRLAIEWNFNYGILFRTFAQSSKEKYVQVLYENLILETEKELTTICQLVGLKYDKNMLDYAENNLIQSGATLEAIGSKERKAIEKLKIIQAGLFVKPDQKKIGLWKKELTHTEANMIWSVCGNLAQKMGYEKDAVIKSLRKPLNYYFRLIRFILFNRVPIHCWYISPFFVKRWIKLIKLKVIPNR